MTAADVAFIRGLIAEHADASRRRLSEKLCAAWGWTQPNGRPRDMVCRGLMLALHRAGHIELPAVRMVPRNPLARRARPKPVDVDQTPIRMSLAELGPLEFPHVRRSHEEATFNGLMEAHHYLGYTQPVGEHLKYLVFAGRHMRPSRRRRASGREWRRPLAAHVSDLWTRNHGVSDSRLVHLALRCAAGT